MKRFFALFLCLCLLLTGCSMTLMGNDKEIPYETFGTKPVEEDNAQMILYKRAMDALANAEYKKAMSLFIQLQDFRDAAEYAARFSYVKDALIRTEAYTNGELTNVTEIAYDMEGNPLNTAGDVGTLLSSSYYDNGLLQEAAWQYPDYTLVQHYNSFMGSYTLSRESKTPLFPTMNEDGIKKGHSIIYTYSKDQLIKDSGEIVYHTLKDGSIKKETIMFEGKYTYDSDGRLSCYDRNYTWGSYGLYRILYTYDDQGRLIREESVEEGAVFGSVWDDRGPMNPFLKETIVKEYRYDEAGNQIYVSQKTTIAESTNASAGMIINENFVIQYGPSQTTYTQTEYSYEKGLLMKETTTFGEDSDTIFETYYVYGDYLSFNPDAEVTDNGS